jgi:hypothetical protein
MGGWGAKKQTHASMSCKCVLWMVIVAVVFPVCMWYAQEWLLKTACEDHQDWLKKNMHLRTFQLQLEQTKLNASFSQEDLFRMLAIYHVSPCGVKRDLRSAVLAEDFHPECYWDKQIKLRSCMEWKALYDPELEQQLAYMHRVYHDLLQKKQIPQNPILHHNNAQ